MKYHLTVPIILCLLFSCDQNNLNQKLKDQDKSLVIKYLFEDNRDTVILGDTVDFAMTFSNVEFDSLIIFVGELDSLTLIDTVATIKVNNNSAFFTFVPNKLGINMIEGLVKEFNPSTSYTIVKSTAFSFRYFCEQPALKE